MLIHRAIFAVTCIIGVFAPLEAQDTRTYHVTYEIFSGVKLIGRPHFIIQDDGVATIVSPQLNGYSLKSTVGNDSGSDPDRIKVVSDLYLAERNQWMHVGTPYLAGIVDKPMTTIIQRPGLDPVRLIVQVNIHFDGKLSATMPTYGKNKCTQAKLQRWQGAMTKPVAFTAE